MRHLLLLRHAKAGGHDPDLPDHARSLDVRGRASGPALRRSLDRAGVVPDRVLVSSARRTLETLAMLELPASVDTVVTDALYLASSGDLVAQLCSAPSCDCLLMVGHNPGLHEFAWMLAGGTVSSPLHARLQEGLPVGTLCLFETAPDPTDATLRDVIAPGDAA